MTAPDDTPDPKVVDLKAQKRRHGGHGPNAGANPNGSARQSQSNPGWRGGLLLNRSGDPRDCIANVAMALRSDPAFAGKVFYNEMRELAVTLSLPWHSTNRLRDWTDVDDTKLAEWCQLRGLMVKPTTTAAAIQVVASENNIHPLRDRVDGLAWDRAPRIDTWLTTYMGVEATPYSATVGRKWLIAAVARVYSPGCKVDTLLILEGGQGLGKSTAISILALDPEWFSDEISDFTTKDAGQDLAGKWIIELAELSAMTTRRVEMERVKAFFSRSVSHYRPSYGRRSQDFPRRCVFAGTTNSDNYLTDPTGGRRYWPVKTGRIDLVALRRDVEQLWAEAVHAFRSGEKWWLRSDETPDAENEQEKRRKVDAWETAVLECAEQLHKSGYSLSLPTVPPTTQAFPKQCVTINSLLHFAIGMDLQYRDQKASTRVGNILAAAGWVRRDKRVDGKPIRFYEPPSLEAVAPSKGTVAPGDDVGCDA